MFFLTNSNESTNNISNNYQIDNKEAINCNIDKNISNNYQSANEGQQKEKRDPPQINEPIFIQKKPFATITGKDAKGEPHRYLGQLQDEILEKLFNTVYDSKKAIINSQMNSGKTYLTFSDKDIKNQITFKLIPYFQKLHKEIFIIYAAPRLALVEQVARDMELIQFSSNKDGKPSKKYTDLVINREYYKPVATTFNNLGRLVNQIKKNAPKTKILLIVDEIHNLLDSSYMNLQEVEQFIEGDFIDFTVGFTATCYTEFEYFGYNILTIDRDFKPKRDFEFHIGMEGKTIKEKTFKSIQLAANLISKNKHKTTLNYIEGVGTVRIFKELLSYQFNDNNIYDLTGKSGKLARENNKFLVSVMENSEALLNSHLIANKTLDVGVNIKKNLDCITYIGEDDFNVLNPTTFFQFPARARTFNKLPVITIIPNLKHKKVDLIDLDTEIRKIQSTCNKLNAAYLEAENKLLWIENNTEKRVSKFDKTVYLVPTGDNQGYIWLDKNEEKFKVYKYKVAEKRIEQKAQNCTLNDIKRYINQFYDATITIKDTTDLNESKVREIEKATKKEISKANENICNKLLSDCHLDTLARIICENSTDISLIRKLRANFKFDDDLMEYHNDYIEASNELYIKYISKDENGNEIEKYEPNHDIFIAQNNLASNLLQYAKFKKVLCCDVNGNLIIDNFSEYQHTIQEAVFTLRPRKLNKVFKLLSYAVFNRNVNRYGIDNIFSNKKTLGKSVLSVEQYKFDNFLIKWITNGKYSNKKIHSKDLFEAYKKHIKNKKFSQEKTFKTSREFISYLSVFFHIKTNLKIGKKKAILMRLRLSTSLDKRKQVAEMLKTLINVHSRNKNIEKECEKRHSNRHYTIKINSSYLSDTKADNEGQQKEKINTTKTDTKGQQNDKENTTKTDAKTSVKIDLKTDIKTDIEGQQKEKENTTKTYAKTEAKTDAKTLEKERIERVAKSAIRLKKDRDELKRKRLKWKHEEAVYFKKLKEQVLKDKGA